jgi:hypothetical protein
MKYPFLNDIKTVVDKNIVTILVVLIFVLYNPFFVSLINELFVNPFFCHLKTSITNDLVIGGLILIVVFRMIINLKNNFFISNKSTFVTVLLLGIGIYYRVFDDVWFFTSTWVSNYLKYFDAVFLLLISNILIRLFYKKKELAVEKELGFCFDNPNKDTSKALKNRIVIAEKIAEKIKNTSDSDSSFAIGVTSEWGRGKTSFINLIESKIRDDKKRIIVHFNPWLNNDEKSLIKSFFDQLSNPLKKYNRELSSDLLKYAELLSTINESSSTKILKGLENFFSSNNNDLRGRFESINNAIKSSGLQIIISIDDLDRLFEKEIVEVLRLIRNSANFANTIFIVAYDRNYLVSSLKKANDYKPGFYLEKIFQLEIALPPFERSVIIERLKELFEERLMPVDKKEFNELLISKKGLFDSPGFRHDLITNLRDVNRLANSFFISYEVLKGEIVLADLLNIELLRSKYLGVYNLLASDYQIYLTTSRGQSTDSIEIAYLRLDKENDEKGNESDDVKLEKYLNTNYTDVGIQKNQINDVIKYVCAVFPVHNQYARIKSGITSITNPSSIDRYFHYNLLTSDLSEIEFSKFRQGSDADFISKIDEWVENGFSNEVYKRLERIKFYSSKEDYEKIIKSIFHYGSIEKDSDNRHLSFDNYNLYNKLNYENVSQFYNEVEFIEFVKHVIESQKPPFTYVSEFINYIFTECRNGLDELNFVIEKEWFIKQKIVFLKSHAESIEKIDVYLFWLFNDCNYIQWETESSTNQTVKKTIEPIEAKEIVKTCAKRLIESFLKEIIRTDAQPYSVHKEIYYITNIVKNIWGSWTAFELFLNDFEEDKIKGMREFKSFYSKCKKHNFEKYVYFDFKDIDLSEARL